MQWSNQDRSRESLGARFPLDQRDSGCSSLVHQVFRQGDQDSRELDRLLKQIAGGIISRLEGLQKDSEYFNLLQSADPDIQGEARRLDEEINSLKARLREL